ncbi:MAG: ABC transporter permease [Christensenellales bacterium]
MKKTTKFSSFENIAYPVFAIALILIVGIFIPRFLTASNILNVTKQSSITAIAAIGQTIVIITGGIDLSCGGIMSFSAMVNGMLLLSGWPIALTLPIALLSGTILGCISGLIIAKLKIPPFMATLVIGNIASGLAMIFCKGSSLANLSDANKYIGNGEILGIALPIWILLIFVVLGTLLLTRTSFGNKVYGIGNNIKVVKNEGVNVDRNIIMVYALSAFCASCAGIVLGGWLNAAHPTQGAYYQLDIIASCVIGGASLLGGEGKVLNSVVGAIIISALRTILNLLAIIAYIQNLLIGSVIIAIVAITMGINKKYQKNQQFSNGCC